MAVKLRLRTAAAFVAGMAIVFAIAWADNAFAVDSLRITAPTQGQTVAGDLRVEGIVGGAGDVDVTLSLSPQVLGDCRPSVLDRVVTVTAGEPFAVSLVTAGLEAGTYCVVAIADDGRLSAAVGDVTIEPGLTELDGFQLPTLSVDGTDARGSASTALDPAIIIPIALGSVAAVSVVVLSAGLLFRRRQLQDS
ncbi:hypothetical protein [Microcella alkaliphila]|jgi:hypothetical protein|uniref:Alr3548 protein n=1 Tax=Microcella alkaliphila TaxID=279828 RepID=A0A0U5BRF5_9MICO|nr:hypothetical protein [Microcella alkaliphila]BAU33499.1 Alr3548 protein [Microcella alkaliphila]